MYTMYTYMYIKRLSEPPAAFSFFFTVRPVHVRQVLNNPNHNTQTTTTTTTANNNSNNNDTATTTTTTTTNNNTSSTI